MAVPPDTNEAFLREVDDELRRDQLVGFWKRWGLWVAAGVVGALALLAAGLWWQGHRQAVAEQQGEQLTAALDELGQGGADKVAKPLADLGANGGPGAAALARFVEADVLLGKKDMKGAAAKFAQVAGDGGTAQPFRDLALVRQTAAEYDSLKPEVVIARLKPLATAGGPWLGSAGEMVAIAYLRQGQRRLAGDMFGQVARGQDVPETIRQRAVQMAGVLGVDAVEGGNGKTQ